MTQTIFAKGTEAAMKKWDEILRQMEANAPKGIERLAAKMNELV